MLRYSRELVCLTPSTCILGLVIGFLDLWKRTLSIPVSMLTVRFNHESFHPISGSESWRRMSCQVFA